MALKLKRSQKRKDPAPRYNILRLRDPEMQQRFAVEVSNRFSALADGDQDDWNTYRDEMNAAAMATLGIA